MMIIIPLIFLLTMHCACLATGPSNLTVMQTPPEVHLSVGDSTEIACIWEKSVERYRLTWYLVKENITKIILPTVVCMSNHTCENKDVLEITSASVNDAGIYYCEIIIEIPFYKKVHGNGTAVTVEEQAAHSLKKGGASAWAIIPFLVAVGSLYLCYRKKQHPKPSAGRHQEQMLEAAELHGRNESTKAAAEENSSSSSAEWAVSTLYESLDSFLQ